MIGADPLHFRVVLDRKPASLNHARVYRDWQVSAAFAELCRDQEAWPGTGRACGLLYCVRFSTAMFKKPPWAAKSGSTSRVLKSSAEVNEHRGMTTPETFVAFGKSDLYAAGINGRIEVKSRRATKVGWEFAHEPKMLSCVCSSPN